MLYTTVPLEDLVASDLEDFHSSDSTTEQSAHPLVSSTSNDQTKNLVDEDTPTSSPAPKQKVEYTKVDIDAFRSRLVEKQQRNFTALDEQEALLRGLTTTNLLHAQPDDTRAILLQLINISLKHEGLCLFGNNLFVLQQLELCHLLLYKRRCSLAFDPTTVPKAVQDQHYQRVEVEDMVDRKSIRYYDRCVPYENKAAALLDVDKYDLAFLSDPSFGHAMRLKLAPLPDDVPIRFFYQGETICATPFQREKDDAETGSPTRLNNFLDLAGRGKVEVYEYVSLRRAISGPSEWSSNSELGNTEVALHAIAGFECTLAKQRGGHAPDYDLTDDIALLRTAVLEYVPSTVAITHLLDLGKFDHNHLRDPPNTFHPSLSSSEALLRRRADVAKCVQANRKGWEGRHGSAAVAKIEEQFPDNQEAWPHLVTSRPLVKLAPGVIESTCDRASAIPSLLPDGSVASMLQMKDNTRQDLKGRGEVWAPVAGEGPSYMRLYTLQVKNFAKNIFGITLAHIALYFIAFLDFWDTTLVHVLILVACFNLLREYHYIRPRVLLVQSSKVCI